MKRKVIKLGEQKFEVVTLSGKEETKLLLDFKAICDRFNLRDKFCLIHWQARPKLAREWGVYDSSRDRYYSIAKLVIACPSVSLQIPDSIATGIPSAVIHAPRSRIEVKENLGTIVSLKG